MVPSGATVADVELTSLQPGLVVADRRLRSRLGRGGEGEVWEADRPDGTRCALKLLRPEVLPAPDEVRRRGRWLVRIDHPALVAVDRGGRFTGGALAGWGFVEMALVHGETLQDVPPMPDALALLGPVAEGLDLLHAGAWSDGVPLVHRDVKPGNLVATAEGLVLVDPSTMRGLDTTDLTRVGTPAYLAPEVATGRFGPLADVYSLGATAAALLTGRRGRGLAEVVTHAEDFDLPPGVVAALDPDPVRRPATCAAVVAEGVPHARHEHRSGPARPAPDRPTWPLIALTVVLGAPAAVWGVMGGPGAQAVLWAALAALAAHLAVHVVTGRAALALLAPPWAWADLLADLRDPEDRRARWAADVIAGLMVAGAGAAAWLVLGDGPRWGVLALVPVVVALAAAVRAVAPTRSRVAWALAWLLALPAKVLGGLPRVLVTGGRR